MKKQNLFLRKVATGVACLAVFLSANNALAQTRFNYTDASGVTCTYENPRIDNGVNSVVLYRVVSIPPTLTKWVMPETVVDAGTSTTYRLIQSGANCTFCDIAVNTTLTEIVFPKYLRFDDSNPYVQKFPNLHKLTFGEFASQFGGEQVDNLIHLDTVVFLGTNVIHSYGFQCNFIGAPSNTKIIVPCGTLQQFVDAFNIDDDINNAWTTANFVEAECLNTLTVLSNDNNIGVVWANCGWLTSNGTNQGNASGNVTLIAIAQGGTVFLGWNDGNLDNPRIVNVQSDVTYTANFAVCSGAGVSEVRSAPAFQVFPNPAKENVTVSFVETVRAPSLLCVFDLNGKIIKQQEVSGSSALINTTSLASGTYIIRLVKDGTAGAGVKFVKE